MSSNTKFASGSRQNYAKAKISREGNPLSLIRVLVWILIFSWLAFITYFLRTGNFFTMMFNANRSSVGGTAGHIRGVPINYIPAPLKSESVQSIEQSPESDFHVIFSTDCGAYQDWQTLIVFHSATVVGQKGPITRIASGCDDKQKAVLTALYEKLYPNYHVHFTPDFKKDEKSQRSYDFYNKPWGVKHWLANAVPSIPEGVAIALIDPDMIFIRPLTKQIRGMPNNLYNKKVTSGELMEEISVGSPVAQMYGLGAPWTNDHHKKFNRTHICGVGSPCLVPDMSFGEGHYAVGPPYVMIKEDMVRITKTWTEFVPRVFEGYPYLLAEMYAYSMAAAHENLPHFQLYNYMVSAVDAGDDEGWALIEALDDVCVPPVDGIFYPGLPLPNVVHYCQTFRVGDIGFAKRQMSKNIFSCDHPMMVEPPRDLIHADYRIKDSERQHLKPREVKRNAYMICTIHTAINAALADYKNRMCDGLEINTEKSYMILPKG